MFCFFSFKTFCVQPGTVRIEMFRNMQNAEIIRKMTEEFDEVQCIRVNVSQVESQTYVTLPPSQSLIL